MEGLWQSMRGEEVQTQRANGPQMVNSLLEIPRVMLEATRLGVSWPTLISSAPKGEPHPVMVLPGFSAGDESTLPLRNFITRLRYKALPWLQGVNTGNPAKLESVMRRFFRMHQVYGTKISLVGQSLGGVFAREIAREFPDAVRCVITLGSPYAAQNGEATNPAIKRLFEEMSGLTVEEMRAMVPSAESQTPLPLPTTSVYSKEDGVVGWQACVEPENELSESVRVLGSHTGMAMNPDVLHLIADRLAQNPASWSKFDRRRGCRQFAYPHR
jgi:pimeloyl-ACP methyl ester carboxylesterase